MKNQSIVIFSSDDWGWKTSKYQLATRFAKQNKVLFVSSIGFRSPTKSSEDIGRIWNKLKKFIKGLEKIEDNLFVLTPLIIPFSWFPLRDRFNIVFLKLQITLAQWKLGMKNPYIFVFSQNWYEYIVSLPCQKLIYYCVDEHSGFSGLDMQKFADLDNKMNSLADIIFCSARSLYQKNKIKNGATYYLPHGVNYELFSSSLNEETNIAEDYQEISKPIFIFFGHMSYDWVDAKLVKYLASQRPGWSWVYIGRYSMKEAEFAEYNNIYLLGEKEFEQLPEYCKFADIGIIPFVYSDLTKNCNPLKLPEYIAAGLPVVSTDIPEVGLVYGEITYVGKDNIGFLKACDDALNNNDDVVNRSRSLDMKQHSWDQRVLEIYKIIHEVK